MVRDEKFGQPAHNFFFADALFVKMKECGHDVEVVMKDRKEVLRMLERVILSFLPPFAKNKARGKLMKIIEKIAFVDKWKLDNHEVL